MARSGARRKPRATAKPAAATRGRDSRAATRHEFSAAESQMFFPKLRNQAKWVFVFLALVFGVGFVVFGVGSGIGGAGLGDLIQGQGSSTGGPSVSDAQNKIDDGNLAAYKELAEAYRAENKQDDAIAAGEQYVKVRPKDVEFKRALASDYEGKATKLREQATAVQDELTSNTGGTIFAPPPNTALGRALPQGRIDQELTNAANTKLTEYFSGIQTAYSRATQLYQGVVASKPDDVLLQLLLAQSAYQAQNNPVALRAYRRVIQLAPDSAEAQQAQQQIQFIKAQAAASVTPSR